MLIFGSKNVGKKSLIEILNRFPYVNQNIIIFLYNIIDIFTYKYVKNIEKNILMSIHRQYTKIFVGNKLDLVSSPSILQQYNNETILISTKTEYIYPLLEALGLSKNINLIYNEQYINADYIKSYLKKYHNVLTNYNKPDQLMQSDPLMQSDKLYKNYINIRLITNADIVNPEAVCDNYIYIYLNKVEDTSNEEFNGGLDSSTHRWECNLSDLYNIIYYSKQSLKNLKGTFI